MTKKRDKLVVFVEESSDSDFEQVFTKKRKSADTNSTIKGAKSSKEQKKTGSDVRMFRANFAPLHDLFSEMKEKGLKLNKDQLDGLRSTTFFPLLEVFIEQKIDKEELTKSNKGLTMLVNTFSKQQGGFNLCANEDVFIPTPEDMALIFGFQLIENGIQEKLQDERKVNLEKYDLCETYNLGKTSPPILKGTDVMVAILEAVEKGRVDDVVRLIVLYMCQTVFFTKTGNFNLPCSYLVFVKSVEVINRISWPHLIHKAMMDNIKSADGDVNKITGCIFYLLFWFAEHCSLIKRRQDAITMTPRFARWDTLKISKSISRLKHFPLQKTEAENMTLSHNLITEVEDGFERKLLTPDRQMSRHEENKAKIMKLENENSRLIQDKDEKKDKLCQLKLRVRTQKNRLTAMGIRNKKDVTADLLQLMETTLQGIFADYDDNGEDHPQDQAQAYLTT